MHRKNIDRLGTQVKLIRYPPTKKRVIAMAIERFVKHVESLHDQQGRFAQRRENTVGLGPIKSVSHLSNDLVKLKDLLKQAMAHKSSVK